MAKGLSKKRTLGNYPEIKRKSYGRSHNALYGRSRGSFGQSGNYEKRKTSCAWNAGRTC